MSPLSVPPAAKYVPTHRAPGKHKAARAPRRALRTGFALTGLATVVAGLSITGGLVSGATTSDATLTPAAADVATTAPAASTSSLSATEIERRDTRSVTSRSTRRTSPTKAAALSMATGAAVTKSQKLSEGDPRDIALALLPVYGFSSDQFSCLDSLYESESGWRVDADNPSSSAYGIPQALTQLHELPEDYMTSAESQIRWGLAYIQGTYGTPCGAWSFKAGNGWY